MSTDELTKYPETYQELAVIMTAALVDAGIAPLQAQQLAEEIKERIRRHYGGQKLYMPATKYTVDYLRQETRRRWNGKNTSELCREFEISESRLRQLADAGSR